jgi:hypothetical protein
MELCTGSGINVAVKKVKVKFALEETVKTQKGE